LRQAAFSSIYAYLDGNDEDLPLGGWLWIKTQTTGSPWRTRRRKFGLVYAFRPP
jgi:hypothetical protein